MLCVDEAVGERRRALLDVDGRPFRLEIERWSEQGRRARLDEVWWARVKGRMPGNRGWFVDLGLDRDGVVEPTRAASVTVGAMLALRVKSEAWDDKGPVLSLADMPPSVAAAPAPGLHSPASEETFLRGVDVVEARTGLPARRAIDAAVDEAKARVTPLPGGGDISVDVTRGLTVIDVDAATRVAEGDAAMFALNLNLAAAIEAARQVSLRGLGGLTAIDFVRMEARRDQRTVVESFRQSLTAYLSRKSEVLELSPLGLCEAAIARRSRSLASSLAASAAEREGLDTLREIESAGLIDRGARINAKVSGPAQAWLDADAIGWQDALAERIGRRWAIDSHDGTPGRPDVWSAA